MWTSESAFSGKFKAISVHSCFCNHLQRSRCVYCRHVLCIFAQQNRFRNSLCLIRHPKQRKCKKHSFAFWILSDNVCAFLATSIRLLLFTGFSFWFLLSLHLGMNITPYSTITKLYSIYRTIQMIQDKNMFKTKA